MTREKQLALSKRVLGLLSRGLCASYKLDGRVRDEMASLGDGFSFSLLCGEEGPHIKLGLSGEVLIPLDTDKNDADVIIKFKDVTGMLPVLLGKSGIATAFCEHRMQVWGDISDALTLVRVIEIAEAYLLPASVLKKSMRRVPKKKVPALFVYINMLFAGARTEKSGEKPETAPEEALMEGVADDS